MDEKQAIEAVHRGDLVVCAPEDFQKIKAALQRFAAQSIDWGDSLRARIALQEVKRLGDLFDQARAP